MTVKVEGNEILVTRPNDEKEARSLHGLTRTLIHNMVVGVTAVSYTHLCRRKAERLAGFSAEYVRS